MSERVTVRFGLGKQMPPGYEAVRLDSGHCIWTQGDRESAIHWDKWAIYRGAWADYRKSTKPSERAPDPAEKGL